MLFEDHMKCLHKDVIRASGVGVFTILRRIKRLLQMMALIMIVAFMTSVLYQNVHGLKDLEVCIFFFVLNTLLLECRPIFWQTITSWANRLNHVLKIVFFSRFVFHFKKTNTIISTVLSFTTDGAIKNHEPSNRHWS